MKYLTATSITSYKVHYKQDEHLGDIKEIMLNVNSGQIEYYIIEFGGFLGIGEKYFAIPFNLLAIDQVNQLCVFDKKRNAGKCAGV